VSEDLKMGKWEKLESGKVGKWENKKMET